MPQSAPTMRRAIVAWVVVILTVIAVWMYVDYRNQPPDIPSVGAPK
jgi:hypothetical protein